MEYRLLGKTGVEVSQLCLGTMPFGGPADEKESAKMFQSCRDVGINFSTVPMYMKKADPKRFWASSLLTSRDQLIITSKAYFPTSDDVVLEVVPESIL
jgi:aryl-alcohol dehydrogenase-like predicted oxidoreductase